MEDLDTSYTDLITCPWCEHEHQDSFEMEDGQHDCEVCEKPFEVSHDVTVTYSTSKVIKQENSNV